MTLTFCRNPSWTLLCVCCSRLMPLGFLKNRTQDFLRWTTGQTSTRRSCKKLCRMSATLWSTMNSHHLTMCFNPILGFRRRVVSEKQSQCVSLLQPWYLRVPMSKSPSTVHVSDFRDFKVLLHVFGRFNDTDEFLTGKRISQKLLRNCVKFLSIIYDVLNIPHIEFVKQTTDEVELRGGESKYDTRRLNSYPSKVVLGLTLSPFYFRTWVALQNLYISSVHFQRLNCSSEFVNIQCLFSEIELLFRICISRVSIFRDLKHLCWVRYFIFKRL